MLEELWYKNAVIYCLDVETFMDGNGDGVGDFIGLKQRLDYLAGLGVTCLWLLPFYPSPNQDNGYDVSDYYGVDPRLGDLGDFVSFMHQARMRGIRVIVDLVANHTSDQHPWFQQARADPRSPFRDYYVWKDEKPDDAHTGMVFPGVQKSTWTYDETARAWYFHRFFHFQPDLNVSNPRVREELLKVMGFWLELGVSGFRVDAVPFLVELKGLRAELREEHGDPYRLLGQMRDFLSWRRGDAVLLAEANVPYDTVREYFGEGGERMQLVFNFPVNQWLFVALAEEKVAPLARALRGMPAVAPVSQWASFLRNHDELDLERLPDAVRRRVFARFGPDEDMQMFGRGLRRRLAPMLGGDPRRLAMAYSLLLCLPGTPVLWYGEELGMGEDLSQEGRAAVRTPMQWSSAPHGGFSRVHPFRPVPMKGRYGAGKVSVAAQRPQGDSLLNQLERLIRLRKESPELGLGGCEVLRAPSASVLALRHTWGGSSLVTLHNLSGRRQAVRVDPGGETPQPMVCLLTGERSRPAARSRRHRVVLEPYGYHWFRMDDGGRDLRHFPDA